MWNQFLNESRTDRKFENTPVLILGNKHSGKRSLIDSLFDVSKTGLNTKKNSLIETSKMKIRGLSPVIDYAYLNVIDHSDPDYRTHSKLQIFMIEQKFDEQVFKQLENPELLKKAIAIIMLDFTNPWSFMEELDGWIKFIYEIQKRAGFSIVQLEQMSSKITNYYKSYHQAQIDENGKLKKNFQQKSEQIEIPLPEGVLTNNLRIPLIISVNKCDLQSSVIREESTSKIQIILYHLRKFCIQYGGTLIYTSIKNNSNLNSLYQYILHRAYKMPLRYKSEKINQEAIFIPFGSDNMTLLQDSILKLDVGRSYAQSIPKPVSKKVNKEEVLVEQDSQFFKKYINSIGPVIPSNANIPNLSTKVIEEGQPGSTRAAEVSNFFQRLLNRNTNTNVPASNPDEQRRNNAQSDLFRHTTMQVELNKTQSNQEKDKN